MMALSEKQLNSLNKKALVIIVTSLQDQLNSMQSQLDKVQIIIFPYFMTGYMN